MKSRILGLLAVGLLAGPMAANALVVTVNAEQWDVTTVTGTYSSLSATLDAQPWWGNQSLAEQFTGAIGDDLGYPNGLGTIGPLFAYGLIDNGINVVGTAWNTVGVGFYLGSVRTSVFTFSIASRVVPEPGTLALLGLGLAGLGLSRRRKAN